MPEETAPQLVDPGYFERVGSNWIYYDKVMIGPGWAAKGKGWYDSFTDLAKKDKLTFFNVRSGSKDGYAYTNMDSTDQIGRPFRLQSFGIRFFYPNPHMADQHVLNYAAAKFFQTILTEHCYLEFWIRDDQWFILNPDMAPDGFGPAGAVQNSPVAPAYTDMMTNGLPVTMNRFHWLDKGIRIPENAQIKLELTFSEYGKEMLEEMANVWPLDGSGEEPFPNAAIIKPTLRGLRYTQMKGKYYL